MADVLTDDSFCISFAGTGPVPIPPMTAWPVGSTPSAGTASLLPAIPPPTTKVNGKTPIVDGCGVLFTAVVDASGTTWTGTVAVSAAMPPAVMRQVKIDGSVVMCDGDMALSTNPYPGPAPVPLVGVPASGTGTIPPVGNVVFSRKIGGIAPAPPSGVSVS